MFLSKAPKYLNDVVDQHVGGKKMDEPNSRVPRGNLHLLKPLNTSGTITETRLQPLLPWFNSLALIRKQSNEESGCIDSDG